MSEGPLFQKPPIRDRQLSMRVSSHERDVLESVATKLDCNIADLMRTAVLHYLEHGPPAVIAAARRARE